MKKLLTVCLISLFSLVLYAQEYDDIYFTSLTDTTIQDFDVTNFDKIPELKIEVVDFSELSLSQKNQITSAVIQDFYWNPYNYMGSYLWKIRYRYLTSNLMYWDYLYYNFYMFDFYNNYIYWYNTHGYHAWNYNTSYYGWNYTNYYNYDYNYYQHNYKNSDGRRRTHSTLTSTNVQTDRSPRKEKREFIEPTTIRQHNNIRKDNTQKNTEYRYPERKQEKFINNKRIDHRIYNKIDNESDFQRQQTYEKYKKQYDRNQIKSTPRTNNNQPIQRQEIRRVESPRTNSQPPTRNNNGTSGHNNKRR